MNDAQNVFWSLVVDGVIFMCSCHKLMYELQGNAAAVMSLRRHIKVDLTVWQLDRSAEEPKQQNFPLPQ